MNFISSFFRNIGGFYVGAEQFLRSGMDRGGHGNRPYHPPESLFQTAPQFDMLMDEVNGGAVGTVGEEYLAWYDPMREGSLTQEQYLMCRYI